MTDIAAIAAQLSEAQRRAVRSARLSWDGYKDRVYGPGVTRKALREHGLCHGDFCFLTPLGLAVRAHLEEQADGE